MDRLIIYILVLIPILLFFIAWLSYCKRQKHSPERSNSELDRYSDPQESPKMAQDSEQPCSPEEALLKKNENNILQFQQKK